METLDCVVIGAGVVGLAVARRLALANRRVVVLEAETEVGQHTSSRNSGVIHAGVYYPPDTLKARLCVTGKQMLYAYLAERQLPHQRIGKLLIAVREREVATLERISRLGQANGVDDLVALSAAEVRALEPALVAVRGVMSPSSGIVDCGALMHALQADLEAAGGTVVLAAPVLGGEIQDGCIELETGGAAAGHVQCHTLVNAAGFQAPTVATAVLGPHQRFVPRAHFAPGHIFALASPAPFQHLVYPMPARDVAHIHFVLDLAGKARFGPDVGWADEASYAFDDRRVDRFYQAIRRYYPDLADGDLEPGYVGIRPKIVPAGAPAADFLIQGPEVHGVAGLVNLFGIESPGLTACLAIAEQVATRLG